MMFNRAGVKNFAWSKKGEVNDCFWHDLIYGYYFVHLAGAYKDCENAVSVLFNDIMDAYQSLMDTFDALGHNDTTAWYIARSFYELGYRQRENDGLPLETMCSPSFWYRDEIITIELPCTPKADFLKQKREEGPGYIAVYAGDREK